MDKKKIIKFHIWFWILINAILFSVESLSLSEKDNTKIFLSFYFIDRVFTIIIFYFFYFTVTSKRINSKKKFHYIFTGLIIIIIFSLPASYILVLSTYKLSDKLNFLDRFNIYFFQEIINLFLFALLGALFKFIFIWYDSIFRQKELERQNLSNELALLRSQINPHFFFNTLNNIKAYANTEPDKTLYIVDKLSETMNYILYDSQVEKVDLNKELDFSASYIELQKIRYNSPDYISFNIKGNYQNIAIPPLLFIPFIENAFKHGSKHSAPPGITIDFTIEKDYIFFHISNYMKEPDGLIETKGGFGLNNIRRRLDLLFGNNYSLDIDKNDLNYSVTLKIERNEN